MDVSRNYRLSQQLFQLLEKMRTVAEKDVSLISANDGTL
jgi:hypothetical protein